ncbi:MAG TPA: AAA family ATPase [Candidatus Sulfotelmatobacter sp.]|nr:AAA family ATPase [Candidatus Sulfotelmatobacter sp.]
MQSAFDFPQPLSEKYRPQRIADFVGLEKAKRIVGKLAGNPFPSAWLFVGPSGTGKTTMGLALAAEMPAELHHIPAKECTLETVQEVCRQCHYCPRQPDDWKPVRFHLVLVDEADQMSYPAQLAFLSKLDATAFPPNTIFVFTCNSTDNLEKRFLSRCRTIEFSSYGMANEIAGLLSAIWDKETDNPVERPNFARIVKDATNNVRDALMTLEVELLAA